MAFSQIKITFNQDLALDETVSFKKQYIDGSFTSAVQTVSETWKNIRTGPGEVSIGTPTGIAGERSAINYMAAVEIDYLWQPWGQIALFSRNGNEVTIRQSIYWSFDITGVTVPDDVDIEISNFSGGLFVMNSNTFETATTNPVCTHYNLNVQFNKDIVKYVIAGVETTITPADELDIELVRGQGFAIDFYDEDDNILYFAKLQSEVPGVINSAMTTINVSSGPQSASVTIDVAYTGINELEYSLNNTTWQSSNLFTGLMPDTHNVYIRDNFGCSFSMQFITNTSGIVDPYTYYSKSNSIHMALRETFGDCGPYPNDDNTLSHETYAVDPKLAYPEPQIFQSCDTPPMEFRSNFYTNTLTIIKEDGTEVNVPISQISNNIGRKDARDGVVYAVSANKTGVRFTSGNSYDYDTEAVTGSYVLNGSLPEYAKIGNWISIDNVWYQIENIYFDDTHSAEVIIVDGAYVGAEQTKIIKSLFNRLNYEVYRASIAMVSYNNTHIQIRLVHEDDNYTTVTRMSEKICVKTKHKNTVKIEYYNDKNTDIFYAQPLVNIIRVPLIKQSGDHEDESEVNKGDFSTQLITSTVFNVKEFEVGPVTYHMYKKVLEAVSHKYVGIDHVGYRKNGSVEKEGPIEESNLYTLKFKMIHSNVPFNINANIIDADLVASDENIEIPTIIIGNDGEFMGY